MKIISSLISAMFTKQIQQLAQSKYNEFLRLEDERREQTRRDIAEFAVGTPVIAVSNQWSNLVVGFVLRVEYVTASMCPVPVVMDYISGQELLCFSVIYDFTQQRLGAFMKLDPYERWVMAYKDGFDHHGKDLTVNDLLEMAMGDNPPLLTYDQAHTRLAETGFFDKYSEFLEGR